MTAGDGSKTALITGAGSGIGRAAAVMLAEAGWRVALAGRTRSKLLETGDAIGGGPGERWLAVEADVARTEDAGRTVGAVTDAWGRLDALVNNAGYAPLIPIAGHDAAELERCFRTNAVGPIALAAAAWPVFVRQGSGCVVNVSSMASIDPFPGLSVYGAAKAATNAIARGIVNEAAEAGLRVRAFAVAPGAVETGMLRAIFPEEALPRERCLRPEDVASVVVDCVLGRRDAQSGSVIELPSP